MNFSRITLFFTYIFISFLGYSQQVIGSRAMALGGNGILLNDAWSVLSNVGNTPLINEIQVATSYSVPYLVSEFQQQAFVGVVPLKKGGISFSGQFSGKDLFRQQKIACGYGMKLSDKFTIGVGLNYQQLRVQNYGVNSMLTVDLGLVGIINEKLSVAASLLSVGGNNSIENQERFPSIFQIGARYQIQKQLQMYFTLDKSSNSKVNYRIGLEYEAFKNGWFRTGAILNAKTIAFGFGYELPVKLRLDIGSQWQQTLGWTPTIGLIYRFTEKK